MGLNCHHGLTSTLVCVVNGFLTLVLDFGECWKGEREREYKN